MARVLLIVDDWPAVGRGLRRLFKKRFTDVLVATTPAEAEAHLGRPQAPPTHLLCDYFLGEGLPLGVDLVARWRREYPQLTTVGILSGSEIARMELPPGVDALFEKPVDAAVLMRFLEEGSEDNRDA
jgi:CheY-like chemotaxis protein